MVDHELTTIPVPYWYCDCEIVFNAGPNPYRSNSLLTLDEHEYEAEAGPDWRMTLEERWNAEMQLAYQERMMKFREERLRQEKKKKGKRNP